MSATWNGFERLGLRVGMIAEVVKRIAGFPSEVLGAYSAGQGTCS
jgi:hypothetical protein